MITNWNRRKIGGFESGKLIENRNRFPAHVRKSVVLRYIYDKVHHKGEDCLIAVCGPTGRGKTAVAGFLSELVDASEGGISYFPLINPKIKDFDPNVSSISDENFDDVLPNVCFGMGQIRKFWKRMALLSDKNEKLTHGRAIIVEEAQNYLNSRSFRSQTNMEALRQLLTGREFGNIYFFTYPNFKRIDSQIKELIHLRINLGPKDVKRNCFRFKVVMNPDVEKYPNGVHFRNVNAYHTMKMDDYILCPPPSKELFRLLREKGRFWKNAMRKGQINKDTGDFVQTLPPAPEETVPSPAFKENGRPRYRSAKKLAEEAIYGPPPAPIQASPTPSPKPGEPEKIRLTLRPKRHRVGDMREQDLVPLPG